MSRIIDNENEKMFNVFPKELSRSNEIAISSAYFNTIGYDADLESVYQDFNEIIECPLSRPIDCRTAEVDYDQNR
jgi:hypothetical protein